MVFFNCKQNIFSDGSCIKKIKIYINCMIYKNMNTYFYEMNYILIYCFVILKKILLLNMKNFNDK